MADLSAHSERINFLSICLEQNLEHLRHVENERLTFISFFLAAVGVIVNVIYSLDGIVTVAMCAILLLMNFVCTRLLIRWNQVFSGHKTVAERIANDLGSIIFARSDGGDQDEVLEAYADSDDPNRYYYFDNLTYLEKAAAEKAATGKPPNIAISAAASAAFRVRKRYTRTSMFFYVVNGITYAIVGLIIIDLIFFRTGGVANEIQAFCPGP